MAHRKDFIPTKDEDFDGWQTEFFNEVTTNAAAWGFTVGDPDYLDLQTKQGDWTAKFAVGKKSAMPNHPQVVAKQTSRYSYESAIRLFNKRYLVSNGAVTDTDRAALGITIADTTRTRSHVPDYSPLGSIYKIEHGLHQVRIVDSTHPDTREMPDGTIGANVFVSISVPGAGSDVPDLSTFYYVGTAHDFSFNVAWQQDFGKTAYYFAQYLDIHGGTSPRSPIFSAVIA